MIDRPPLLVTLLAGGGAAALFYFEASLPRLRYAPAAAGAVCAALVTAALLRELRRRDALSIAAGAGALGFLAGAAAGSGAYPWPVGFAAAWLPSILLFLGGIGRERLAFELARLEDAADTPSLRPAALARAAGIRGRALEAARALDPERSGAPVHAGDPRAVYAYAAHVAGYALYLDGRYGEAVASLGEVPSAWMPSSMRALMRSNLSHWRLCAGDLDGAREAVAEGAEEGAPAAALPMLRGARAAVLARAGEPDAALELVGREDGALGEPPAVQQRYRVTRAHALAAKGELAAARAELERVLEDAGVDELRRWLPAGGPALAVLRELAGEGGPADEPGDDEPAGDGPAPRS